jgi:hypothetical protein
MEADDSPSPTSSDFATTSTVVAMSSSVVVDAAGEFAVAAGAFALAGVERWQPEKSGNNNRSPRTPVVTPR